MLIELSQINKTFKTGARSKPVAAVQNVSLQLEGGTTLGLVGESGSGKSTLGRIVTGLAVPDSGDVVFEGTSIRGLRGKTLRYWRRDVQMVFQDPFSSLDPSWTIASSIMEPLRNYAVCPRARMRDEVDRLLGQVGLDPRIASRSPGELSGGQRQRVAIARALAPRPKLIVADEAVSALDVSTQAEVINLLDQLKLEFGLTYLFISHDMGVVRHFSDRVAVMREGGIVEVGSADKIYDNPSHPYTKELLAAAPSL